MQKLALLNSFKIPRYLFFPHSYLPQDLCQILLCLSLSPFSHIVSSLVSICLPFPYYSSDDLKFISPLLCKAVQS